MKIPTDKFKRATVRMEHTLLKTTKKHFKRKFPPAGAFNRNHGKDVKNLLRNHGNLVEKLSAYCRIHQAAAEPHVPLTVFAKVFSFFNQTNVKCTFVFEPIGIISPTNVRKWFKILIDSISLCGLNAYKR